MSYQNRDGKAISLDEWAVLFQDNDYSRIGLDDIGPYSVSTVWLGAVHFGKTYFETMIFGPKDQGEFQERYQTEEQAIYGHNIVCDALRYTIGPIDRWILVG